MQNEIAVRLFSNPKYGTTYAKGVRHQALFNATADIKHPQVKYLLDFYTYEHWEFLAKANQLDTVNQVRDVVNHNSLVSWVVRYNPATKEKVSVCGFGTLDLQTHKLLLFVIDEAGGIEQNWTLTAKPCKTVNGKNVADLLATNSELAGW